MKSPIKSPLKITAGILAAGVTTYFTLVYLGNFGKLETPGAVNPHPRPAEVTTAREVKLKQAAEQIDQDSSQILFGDLHAHTTYSIDAFQYSLGLMGGEGAHPPADACDFARHCSSLDFWSINDHAEHFTPQHWLDTKESIRQCNATAGDPSNPDMVAYLGWEWTHQGTTADNHFGHKNVILRETAEDKVPTRPIHAISAGTVVRTPSAAQKLVMPMLQASDRQRVYDFVKFTESVYSYENCPEGVDVRDLPLNCREGTRTPAELYEKLDQWGFDSLVIPHGNTWGLYTPAGTTWDKQLKAGNHSNKYQRLIEVFSGHGNSEEYRDWVATRIDELGNKSCPPPSDNYLPSCWRAGEIIEERCLEEGGTTTECEVRAEHARQIYVNANQAGFNVVGGATLEDWLNSGQCTDCSLPSFNLRPGGSAQYSLSVTNFDDKDNPQRFNFGFIASSDNHVGRPGTGYKEYDRYGNTETAGVQDEFARKIAYNNQTEYSAKPLEGEFMKLPVARRLEHERASSFFYTGGLVAVHAPARDRDSIWNSLQSKQVYGTSGERILLWFDLLNSDEGKKPMGSELAMQHTPRFKVSAVGAFKQKPGCPDFVANTLTTERMETLCRGECYNPSDERKLITRIEIIRIKPQMEKNEAMKLADGSSRIEDVWKTFECEPDQNGCTVEFEDPEFTTSGRDMVYYARAIQEPSSYINAGNMRPQYDESGRAISVELCHNDKRTDPEDNCLGIEEGRAWSSPIFINQSIRNQQ